MQFVPGTSLGPYDIVALIGAGGMGEVYRARDTRLSRHVAIKVLAAGSDSDRALLEEARAASALNHPHICTIYEIAEAGGRSYVVMELVEGRTLADLIASHELRAADAIEYGIQITDALSHAHGRGVIHRDLKPGNVIVNAERRLKLLDFGIARRVRGDVDEITRTASIEPATAGTLAYVAPETLRGRAADARADLWAVGVLLYEMGSGALPFRGRTGFELAAAIIGAEVPPLPAHAPAALRAIIVRCLEKEPGERYQRAADVRAALQALAGEPQGGGRRPRAPRARRQLRSGRIRSLAVLPLANVSRDPEQEYFADGMTEAIIAELAQIQGLRVISRTSIMRFKGSTQPIRAIADELGVDCLIEGSVLLAGGRVRVTVQLIDAARDQHLWARSYERPLEDVLQLQAEVARAVADGIKIAVTPQQKVQLARRRQRVHPDAYTLYLKGLHDWYDFTDDGMRRAHQAFTSGIEIAPDFAPLHVGLANCYVGFAWQGTAPPAPMFRKAKEAAQRALELDETLPELYGVLGYVATFHDWDWKAADRALLRALELNPGSATALLYRAWYLNSQGRLREAVEHVDRAAESDPLGRFILSNQAYLRFFARRDAEAIQHGLRALALEPHFVAVQWAMGWSYTQLGDYERGIAAFQKAAERPDVRYRGSLAYGYAAAGQQENARALLAELLAPEARVPPPPGEVAKTLLALGAREEALHWLERGYEERDPWMAYLAVDPTMDALRSEPRFRALLARLKLPESVTPV